MMKKILGSVLLMATGLMGNTAHADMLGVYASADFWQYKGDASFAQTDTKLQNFVFNEEKKPSFSVTFEHPLPLIPNIRLRHTQLQLLSENNQAFFIYNNKPYAGLWVDASADLSNTDATLYYEILDNFISIDVGLNAKKFNGEINIKDKVSQISNITKMNQVIPMLYVSAGAVIPMTGVHLKAEVSAVKYNESKLIDASAEIKLNVIDTPLFDLGVKAGYRQFQMDLVDVDNIDAHAKIKGPYAGLEAHF